VPPEGKKQRLQATTIALTTLYHIEKENQVFFQSIQNMLKKTAFKDIQK